jgi:uncharacterized protein (DUF305 family)
MPAMSSARRATLLALLLVLAAGCGGGGAATTEQRPVRGGIDKAYLERMIGHLQREREMAAIAVERAAGARVRRLAEQLEARRAGQLARVQELAGRLRDVPADPSFGVPPAEAGEEVPPDFLRGAQPFDRAFLDLFRTSLQGGLRLAEAERARGGDAEVKALADQLAQDAIRELRSVERAAAS